MIKNLIIGSSFSSLGGALALIKKKEKATIILGGGGGITKKRNQVFDIKLPTRDWSRYQNNIKSAFYVNNFNVNKKYNFISYLGPGGLSKIWGKVVNTNVPFDNNLINFLITKLKIKVTKISKFKKLISLYQFNNLVLNPIKIFKKYKKNLSIIKNLYVEKIYYDPKNFFFNLILSNKKTIKCKKLYLASGLFSSVSLLKSLFNNNFKKKKINISHNDLVYGFSVVDKNYFINSSINNIRNYYYFDISYKKFCGRISVLSLSIIKKYNLNFFFSFIFYLSNFLGFKILLLSLMYKRKFNFTNIIINQKKFFICAKPNSNKKVINLAKQSLNNYFKSSFYFPFKSRIGSDFHYSSNILNNINFININKKILKNLFILDSSCVINKPFFPVFYYIINSYYRVLNNIHLLNLKKSI
jgi:hypothetical protein